MPERPAWIRRFTAPTLGFSRWSAARPERLAYVCTQSGSWQAWTADLGSGTRRQVSSETVGVEQVLVTPDGERVVWWRDAAGDERGHWVAVPFEGGDPKALVAGVPDGWAMGASIAPGVVAVGLATDHDYAIFVSRRSESPTLVYQHAMPAGVGREWPQGSGGLSADGDLLCIRHGEHGDILHPALRLLDAHDGTTVADLAHPGRRLDPVAWSPVAGDQRLAVSHELGPFERPAVWDPAAGDLRELEIDLPGAVFPVDWWPDASALLLRHEHEGREQLFEYDLGGGTLRASGDVRGEILDAAVRPDGDVWLLTGDSVRAPRLMSSDGLEVIAPEGDPAPDGRPYRSLWFTNPEGQRIQSFVAEPSGAGPHPVVMHAHGGPEWHVRDCYDPEIQALVDHGYVVAMVNYRGSTGYGIAFRESLVRNIGFPESQDVLACLDALVAEGAADPERAFFAGWSWGGYLACLNVGLNPDRWRAVFAGIPTGDYLDAHENASPPLQAWDVAVMGGHPADVPDLYRERDPMTYVHRGKAPTLIIAGENDSRCPLSSAVKWTEAYREHGGEVDMYVYPAGHHANDTGEKVRQMELILKFFGRFA
jgi:dipeptidyl aminopeptidase/acylaminoacyl peptidase